MPKKRHFAKYSKPPSIAPPTLQSSSSSQANSEQHERSVNEILASMRRSNLNTTSTQLQPIPGGPIVLPSSWDGGRYPEPRPRRLQRRDINGRLLPPGPPPPRSWLSLNQSRHAHAPADTPGSRMEILTLPGAYIPEDGSLVDIALRRIALSWSVQKDWNRFYLYTMPGRMRAALIHYVSKLHAEGISGADLRLILEGPPESELAQFDLVKPDPEELNRDMFYLDLTTSIGRSVAWKTLIELLAPAEETMQAEIQDSWETPQLVREPKRLLPNLSHLSLSVSPGLGQILSWKHLLTLASKLPKLTHLGLAGWPAPSMTPNATLTQVVSPITGRVTSYGGTNVYSHTLDDDWSEAVILLRRLSKILYGLEVLDLTGCGDWFPALRKVVNNDITSTSVDWSGDWGKIATLRLCSGYAVGHSEDYRRSQSQRIRDWESEAQRVARHIRYQRAGQGQFVHVETDDLKVVPDAF